MKVHLGNLNTPADQTFSSLTIGRAYEVLGIEDDHYRLINDCVEPVLFDPKRFDIVDAIEPSFWVSNFGDEGERYAYPRAWIAPGYFEDWHDDVGVVRQKFSEELALWYPLTAQEGQARRST